MIKKTQRFMIYILGVSIFIPLCSPQLYAYPGGYEPYALLECGSNSRLFSESCYKRIRLLTKLVKESGSFADVISVASFSYLHSRAGVYPLNTSEKGWDKNKKQKEYVKKIYPVEYNLLVDKNEKYTVLYVLRHQGNFAESSDNLQEWKDTTRRWKSEKILYFDESEFWIQVQRNFFVKQAKVVLKFPENTDFYSSSVWNRLSTLERKIYQIKGVKQIYSGRHAVRSMQLITGLPFVSQTDRQNVYSLWELLGQARSSFWNISDRTMTIELYGDNIYDIDFLMNGVVNAISNSGFQSGTESLINWFYYSGYDREFRKSLDRVNALQRVDP